MYTLDPLQRSHILHTFYPHNHTPEHTFIKEVNKNIKSGNIVKPNFI